MSADVMSGSPFTEYSIESAPAAARRFLTATRDHLGYVPAGMARWRRRRRSSTVS
jgi:hypothetical protein